MKTISDYPYSDYYVYQSSDGRWQIAPFTCHQWNGKPTLPCKFDTSSETHAEAYAKLAAARTVFTAGAAEGNRGSHEQR